MHPFTNIPLKYIHRYLSIYNISIPFNDDDCYYLAWDLINNNKIEFAPTNIQDWIHAYKITSKYINSPKYRLSLIQNGSRRDLDHISKKLGLTDRDRIINILYYLDMIEYDVELKKHRSKRIPRRNSSIPKVR